MAAADVNDCYAEDLCFRGYARVDLRALRFDDVDHRPISDKNVARLLRVFETEGCRRFDANNFIKAVVEETDLQQLVVSQEVERSIPDAWDQRGLANVVSILCLDGLHRVEAAKRFLDSNDQWWIISVYIKGN